MESAARSRRRDFAHQGIKKPGHCDSGETNSHRLDHGAGWVLPDVNDQPRLSGGAPGAHLSAVAWAKEEAPAVSA